MDAIVKQICISPDAGASMITVETVRALAGKGLEGDRYCTGEGSFSKGEIGRRQVTFMNAHFFTDDKNFLFQESRRNILVQGVELMWLIGREFSIGDARFRGLKYCDPCLRPSALAGKKERFKDEFHDQGGLVAEILTDGLIRTGQTVSVPAKGY